jgi:pimeloyl-ACP methyl ester carboxylesterase
MINQCPRRFGRSSSFASTVVLLSVLAGSFGTTATAQDPPPQPIKLTANGFDEASRTAIAFPEPTETRLTTRDHFELMATYYQGVHGRNTPVVILVHDVLGSRADLLGLAAFLQTTFGYAVLVPDLRGHGDSKKTGTWEIDPKELSRAEFEGFTVDIEACKRFLLDRNDADELNIDLLAVIAVGKSCIPAVNWALADWSFPQLAGLRQGQDVKAVVLISPEQVFKGVRMTAALRTGLFNGKGVERPLRMLLAAGKDNDALNDEFESIRSIVARDRKVENKEVVDGLFVFHDYETNGAALTNPDGGDLPMMIGQFVFFELYEKSGQFPWQQRGKK